MLRDDLASNLREAVIKQLRKSRRLEVVATAAEADAIVKGSGSVWVMGYVSADPRSPANTRQADYRGFLSVEVVGKASQP
jgi:hypothetical protein